MTAPNKAHALDGGIPALLNAGCHWPAASDEHRWMNMTRFAVLLLLTAPLLTGCYTYTQVKLPNAERAFIEIAKLRDYSLSPLHKEGRHKARVFASALGLDASDAEWLAERLKEAVREQECQLGENTPHGQRYLLDFGLRRDQKAARLRSVWNVRPGEDFPRLVTCYVL